MKKNNRKSQREKGNKNGKKKQNIIEFNLMGFIIVLTIIIIVGTILYKQIIKKHNDDEYLQICKYVEEKYLNETHLKAAEYRDVFEEKLYYIVTLINKENGKRLQTITEAQLKQKYKEIYEQELELDNGNFVLPDYYQYDEQNKILKSFNDSEELVKNDISIYEDEVVTTKMQISAYKKITKNKFELYIENFQPKNIMEFIDYAQHNEGSGFDMQKLENLLLKSSLEQEDYDYLLSLINDKNKDKLTEITNTSKIVLIKHNNKYELESYEILK